MQRSVAIVASVHFTILRGYHCVKHGCHRNLFFGAHVSNGHLLCCRIMAGQMSSVLHILRTEYMHIGSEAFHETTLRSTALILLPRLLQIIFSGYGETYGLPHVVHKLLQQLMARSNSRKNSSRCSFTTSKRKRHFLFTETVFTQGIGSTSSTMQGPSTKCFTKG
jgi:hypothetical protein